MRREKKNTHTYTITTQKRIHNIKRPMDVVVGTKKRKHTHTNNNITETHAQYQTITGDGRWDKKKKNTHANTHIQQQHRGVYTIPNDRRRPSLKQTKKNTHKHIHIHNNNADTHTQYQTITGGGRWDKKKTYIHNNNS